MQLTVKEVIQESISVSCILSLFSSLLQFAQLSYQKDVFQPVVLQTTRWKTKPGYFLLFKNKNITHQGFCPMVQTAQLLICVHSCIQFVQSCAAMGVEGTEQNQAATTSNIKKRLFLPLIFPVIKVAFFQFSEWLNHPGRINPNIFSNHVLVYSKRANF